MEDSGSELESRQQSSRFQNLFKDFPFTVLHSPPAQAKHTSDAVTPKTCGVEIKTQQINQQYLHMFSSKNQKTQSTKHNSVYQEHHLASNKSFTNQQTIKSWTINQLSVLHQSEEEPNLTSSPGHQAKDDLLNLLSYEHQSVLDFTPNVCPTIHQSQDVSISSIAFTKHQSGEDFTLNVTQPDNDNVNLSNLSYLEHQYLLDPTLNLSSTDQEFSKEFTSNPSCSTKQPQNDLSHLPYHVLDSTKNHSFTEHQSLEYFTSNSFSINIHPVVVWTPKLPCSTLQDKEYTLDLFHPENPLVCSTNHVHADNLSQNDILNESYLEHKPLSDGYPNLSFTNHQSVDALNLSSTTNHSGKGQTPKLSCPTPQLEEEFTLHLFCVDNQTKQEFTSKVSSTIYQSKDEPSVNASNHQHLSQDDHTSTASSTDTGLEANLSSSDFKQKSLPHYKCHYCGKSFSSQCSPREHTAQEKGSFTCTSCGTFFSATRSMMACRLPRPKGKNPLKCKECGKTSTAEKTQAAQQSSPNNIKPFNCPLCDATFRCKHLLNTHVLNEHERVQPFVCDICGKRFKLKSGLTSHQRIHSGERPFCCKECGRTFIAKSTFNVHLRVHTGEKAFSCETCGRKFSLAACLARHQQSHKDSKSFTCNVCNKTFALASHLRLHGCVHANKKMHYCQICQRSFSHLHALRVHEKIHGNSRTFPCAICGKSFGSAAYLRRHQRIHTGENLHHCDECGIRFLSAGHLRSHLQVHSHLPSFICSDCGRKCVTLDNLARHRRIHTDDCFKCEVCEKRFVTRQSLSLHQRTHSKEKPYACSECGKHFAYLSSVLRHASVHTEEKPFRCDECGKCFRLAFGLRAHVQSHRNSQAQTCTECGRGFSQMKMLLRHECAMRDSDKGTLCKVQVEDIAKEKIMIKMQSKK